MIKVGDWMKYKSTGEIAKACVVDNDKFINGVCIDDCTKLPIKFKGFEIVLGYARNWECYRNTKSIGKIHFVCIQEGVEYFTGFKVPHESFVIKYCNTIPQSELWIEFQYATMLAKARGLV